MESTICSISRESRENANFLGRSCVVMCAFRVQGYPRLSWNAGPRHSYPLCNSAPTVPPFFPSSTFSSLTRITTLPTSNLCHAPPSTTLPLCCPPRTLIVQIMRVHEIVMPSIPTPNGVSNVGNEKNIVFVRYRIESGFRLSRSFRIFWIDAIEGGNSFGIRYPRYTIDEYRT